MMRIKDFLEYVSLLPEDCIEVKILPFLCRDYLNTRDMTLSHGKSFH